MNTIKEERGFWRDHAKMFGSVRLADDDAGRLLDDADRCEELMGRLRELEAEVKRLQEVIIRNSGCFSERQIAALFEELSEAELEKLKAELRG